MPPPPSPTPRLKVNGPTPPPPPTGPVPRRGDITQTDKARQQQREGVSPRSATSPRADSGLLPLEVSKMVEINPDVIGRPERRAKVYSLDVGGTWVDRGTGFVDIVVADDSEAIDQIEEGNAWIVVAPEVGRKSSEAARNGKETGGDKLILQSPIQAKDCYSRHTPSILIWTELDQRQYALMPQTDIAISFQDRAGAIQIWNMIQEVNKEMLNGSPRSSGGSSTPTSSPRSSAAGASKERSLSADSSSRSSRTASWGATPDDDVSNGTLGPQEPLIPYPTMNNIMHVVSALKEAGEKFPITFHRRVVEEVTSPEWKGCLCRVFHEAESSGNEDVCAGTAAVVRALIGQNEADVLYSLIQSEDIYMDILGMLEHDATYRQAKHRSFVSQYHPPSNRVCFPPTILDCVHLNYRIGYLRDSVLAALIDEQSFTTFATLQYSNSLAILDYITKNYSSIFSNLLPKESERKGDEEHWREERNNGIRFVLEVLVMCRLMPPLDRKGTTDMMKRPEVYESVLRACTDVIAEMDDLALDAAVEILVTMALACPVAVWDFCDSEGGNTSPEELVQKNRSNGITHDKTTTTAQVDTPCDDQSIHPPLPALLVGLLSSPPSNSSVADEGILSQIRDVIQLLLEPAFSDTVLTENLMTTMYSDTGLVSTLLRVLANPTGRQPYGICACYELLSYCVRVHKTGRARYLLSHRLGQVVDYVTRNVRNLETDLSAPKTVVVAGLRFVLSVLYTKDPIFAPSLEGIIPAVLEYLHNRQETARSGGKSDRFGDDIEEEQWFESDDEEDAVSGSDEGRKTSSSSGERGRNYFQDSPRPTKKTSGSILASPIEERRTPRKNSNAVASLLEQYLEDIDADEDGMIGQQQPSKRLRMSFDENDDDEFNASLKVAPNEHHHHQQEGQGEHSLQFVGNLPTLVTEGLAVEDSDSENEG
ncbi:Platinum sensitivity protein [Perkinsus chesapeaki]|uniref:Platinum sensitivity protein n=1 Tax=Perkinsus chesapeaki TaxID=330153 RepID=A0A7J6MMQ3_PERCH|nr:Platinum sensitivity protein [Perkinsus chesapeaki]